MATCIIKQFVIDPSKKSLHIETVSKLNQSYRTDPLKTFVKAKKKSPVGSESCNLVRQVDYRWNHFVPSLYLLHSKLEKFGLAYINNEVVYVGDKGLVNV